MSFHCALNVNFISFRQHSHSTILSTRLLAVVVPGQPAASNRNRNCSNTRALCALTTCTNCLWVVLGTTIKRYSFKLTRLVSCFPTISLLQFCHFDMYLQCKLIELIQFAAQRTVDFLSLIFVDFLFVFFHIYICIFFFLLCLSSHRCWRWRCSYNHEHAYKYVFKFCIHFSLLCMFLKSHHTAHTWWILYCRSRCDAVNAAVAAAAAASLRNRKNKNM